jgi:hypothetical protein
MLAASHARHEVQRLRKVWELPFVYQNNKLRIPQDAQSGRADLKRTALRAPHKPDRVGVHPANT